MVQLDLNLMLVRTVPAFNVLRVHNHEHVIFANLHANENPSRATHEHTVQACATPGT